ncbi:PREDICTED: uncharacterized acetyltransferase At3g50280-like [Nelumbo nucifera]|uniref:Uncharacterized protein n=2 Tax=Nelumbo nucifera TaxID=4432 RepID=A0A822XFC2_NELNU|nr:PREDICTED: uncharacterized acetyltransferase At3g50280-like [Nelumbo nucifera]DAD18602.1 TPA_asm: hypothetical protein HUJ06_020065 [Nelumbo nucifera]
MISSSSLMIISKCIVFLEHESSLGLLKLSVSDLHMLSCHYLQKGLFYTHPPLPIDSLLSFLKRGLSKTLIYFPALAGRLIIDDDGYVYISCNDAGIDFLHANAAHLPIRDILSPIHVLDSIKELFAFDRTISYDSHFKPIATVHVTDLADGIFIGCIVNHVVADSMSFWNFFNAFAEVCRGVNKLTRPPDFCHNFVNGSLAVLRFPEGGPQVTFSADAPLSERIFHFSREAILKLKCRANKWVDRRLTIEAEILALQPYYIHEPD